MHFEICGGSLEDVLEYLQHTGLHADKGGELFHFNSFGSPAESSKKSGGIYDKAIDMLYDGMEIATIVRELGGGILPQMANLMRLESILFPQEESHLPSEKSKTYGKLRLIKCTAKI